MDLKICTYCEDEFKENEKITYIKNAFASSHRTRKYHDDCFDEMENEEKLHREEVMESNKHDGSYWINDDNPSGTWIQNWQTDNPNYE